MALTNEQAIALVKKNPVISAAVLVCLLTAGGIYWRTDSVPEATALLEQKTAESLRLASNIKNAAQLGDQLAALTAANKEIDSRLVRVGQLANNLQYFYKLESETGAKLMDLRQVAGPPRNEKEKGGKSAFNPVTFNVSVNGTYPQVLDFLRRLESGTHYCRVLTATVNPTGGPGGENSAGSNLLLRSDGAALSLNIELLGLP